MGPERFILLVEDNEDDIDLTLRAFQKNNILNTIEVVRDGQEAVDFLLEAARPLPEVVLLDIRLPRLDGFEVLKVIRNHPRTRHLPVVMLTSSAHERDIIDSYGNGANSYVQKPVVLAEFIDAVRQLGAYWLLLNQRDRSDG